MSGALIEAMIGALPLPSLFVADDAHILAANTPAQALLGEGLAGRHFMTALRQPRVIEAVERCLSDQVNTRARYLGNDGQNETVFDVSCGFVESGPDGALITLTDLTDAETTSQIRRDFVANVSHELRTPLTAVMGFIETLQGPAQGDPRAQARFLDTMAREASRMNRLIDDLLSLSRVESTERRRPTELICLDALLGSVVHALSPLANERDIALHLDLETKDIRLAADADQLRQVFSNLIENAIKYGGENISVRIVLQSPGYEPRLRGQGVRIRVRDTGPGFDPIHIPRLTERFYRIDGHRSREMGGTGLGLAIAKHIISRHRGRLEVQSAIGQGSEFTVVLPMTQAVL